MNTLWFKAWADLWLYKTRTFLAISSIAIGLFSVGTLFGMVDLLLTKMDQSHQQSSPSDINLILRKAINKSWLQQIKQMPDIAGVDSMTQLAVRYRQAAEADWLTGIIIARPSPGKQQFDKTSLISGHWPLDNQVAIENMSANMTGLKPGDIIELETKAGMKSMQVSGIVRHPFVKPPKFGGQVHFFIDSTHTKPFGTDVDSFRQLLIKTTQPIDVEKTRAVAAKVTQILLKNSIAINVTLLQDPEKHWGRPFLTGVTGVLKIMALASLVLAGVLIINILSAHITQQTHQIGVMKAIGANTSAIATLYFSEVIIMALIAIAIAVPLSLVTAYFSASHLLGLFNINYTHFDYSLGAINYMLLAGIVMPILAAIVPIMRGSSMTVRKAIASYGLVSDFGLSRFDLWLERLIVQFLPTLFAATLGNLFRRKTTALLTQSVLVIAGVLFMVLMSLTASLKLTLDNEMARSQYAVQLGFQTDQEKQQAITLAQSVSATKKVEVWRRLAMQMSVNNQVLVHKGTLGAELMAIPASSKMYQPLIEQGRWFEAEDKGEKVLVISADSAKMNKLKVGDKINVQFSSVDTDWEIIGIYRWLVTSSYNIEPVYVPFKTLTSITKDDGIASLLMLDANINSLKNETEYVTQLKQIFQNHSIALNPYNTRAKIQHGQFATNQFKPVISTLSGLTIMIASIGGISLSGILVINVLQRTREIGVLSAIGAKPSTIFRMFLTEGMLHGFFAWLISVPIAYITAKPIANELGVTMFGIRLDFIFDCYSPFYWFCLILIIAFLASYWPAKKAMKVSVIDCLSN